MEKRIESKTSNTAEFTCLARALSFTENNEFYKSNDYISVIINNTLVKYLIKIPYIKNKIKSSFPAGMYEYVISRTKYIDRQLKTALNDGFEQILIFGAGFDSRGIRFHDISDNSRIFELDAPVTQNVKIGRYKEKGVNVPENLIFVPIDFDRQSLSERLMESGFKKGLKSFFLLEGLTMYLQPESVDSTFKIIREFSGTGSKVVFDYIYASVVRGENLYEGEKELFQSVTKKSESFCFGIEKGNANGFLYKYDLEAIDILDSNALEDMFFRDKDGKLAGKVNGTHCIVMAKKKD